MARHAHAQRRAFRFGRMVGGVWRGYVRRERRVAHWLVVGGGMPRLGAKALLWSVKLALLAGLLYAAFWLALLLLFVIAAVWVAGESEPVEEDMGVFMGLDELRKVPGYDPVPYNDSDHPDFPDEKDL